MSSTYITQTLVEDVALDLEPNMNVVLNSSSDYNNTYTEDSGVTIKLRKPDFGADLTSGIDVSSADGDVVQASVDVTLAASSKIVTMTALEQTLSTGGERAVLENIVRPRVSKMAGEIQKSHLEKMFLNIGAFKLLDSGTGDYKDVRELGAKVEVSKIIGDRYFATSPMLGAKIKDSGLGYFQASTLDKTFSSRAMGDIDEIKCMTTPDISTIVAGTHAFGSGTTLRVKTKVDTEGATGFTLEVNGGTATLTGTVKKGEIITLAGYYGVDVEGVSTGELFPFVVQSDATASGNELAIVCQPIYFTGPNKNVSASQSTGIAATTAATFQMTASATYRKGILWMKPCVVFANRKLAEVRGFENTTMTSLKGITFLQTIGGNYLTAKNSITWRLLYGSAITYCQGVAGLYVKV